MMTTQTLETIPKETVAPATPERVISDVPKTKPAKAKNPGRVASGKRLAERNRLAREAKNKPKHRNPLKMKTQTRQNNQATAAQMLVIFFLELVV